MLYDLKVLFILEVLSYEENKNRHFIKGKSEFVEPKEKEPMVKVGWIVRRISELPGKVPGMLFPYTPEEL